TENGNLMHSLSLGVNRILGLAISPNGKLLATMTDHFNPKTKQQDMHLVLWNLPNGKKVFSRKTPVIPTRCYYLLPPLTSIWVDRNVFSFSPKGSFLAVAGVGSKGYTVAIFKAESGKVDREIVLQNRFMAISFHPQNESLIFVHEEFSRDILDPLRPASLNVPALWFFSDTLTCWHLKETGLKEFWKTKELVTHSLHSWIDPTSAFAFSPDGKLIAIVTLGSKVKLFRIEGD
ncbi:MAG: WD40 repeat domain-containing protein, partial [Armatimonadetes bacterium]|nr:WD40 repeat domain-containing protein [Armatimonadota bacterium]